MGIILKLTLTLLLIRSEIPNNISKINCSEENNTCLIITNSNVLISDLDLKIKKILDFNPEEIKAYHPIWVNEEIYFVQHFGGKVLRLTNNTITRIDNSYTHRSQLLAPLFEYDDKIYRFGGYGFFDARNFFTYFDTSSKEWEVLKTDSSIIPEGLFDSKYIIVKDDLFLLGGKKINQNDRTNFLDSSEIWRFNIKEKKWYFIGQTNKFESLTMENSDFTVDSKLYFFKNQSLIEFDTENLTFAVISNFPLIEKLSKHLSPYVHFGKLKYFTSSHNEGTKVQLNTIDLEVLNTKSEFIMINSWNSNNLKVVLFISILSTVLILFLLLRKRRAKNPSTLKKNSFLEFNNEYLFYESNSVGINENEYQLLKLFANNPEVYTEKIIDLFSSREVTFSQKLRLKDSLIEKVNIKLDVLFSNESDKLITQERSESDKRIRIYKLNVDIQEI